MSYKIPKAKSLYVHVPFCRNICSYCDFPKVLLKSGYSERYISVLLKEDEKYDGFHFDTIYIGGGTPSCLSYSQLETLLYELTKRHGQPIEFTIECNPEDVNLEFATLIGKYGINRISLGGQTIDDSLLRKLGRKHTFADVIEAVNILRSVGIENISVDFIYGLMGQTVNDIENDLAAVKTLKLPHVSFYSLQVEPNTLLEIQNIAEPDEDFLASCYELILDKLTSFGLNRYEVSNFSKPGYESKHNLCYWHADPFAAIGMGATSYEDGIRQSRTRSIEKYLQGDQIWNKEVESEDDLEFEFIMLNLRLANGFYLDEFKRRFNKDFLVEYDENIEKVKEYLEITKDRVKVKDEHLYILDSILVELLKF